MQDRIERTIELTAPIERVWAAITDPAEVAKWFGDIAEIDLRPGGDAVFGWTAHDNRARAIVEAVDAPRHFAYRWAVDSDTPVAAGPSTLVEFHLEELSEGGTLLRLVESGFASIPGGRGLESFESNATGWKAELDDLGTYLSKATG